MAWEKVVCGSFDDGCGDGDIVGSLSLYEDDDGHSCTCSDWLGKGAIVLHFGARS